MMSDDQRTAAQMPRSQSLQ